MTAWRVLFVLAACTAIALLVVFVRIEQAGSAARAMSAERQWVQLRRELWGIEASVSRLRAPERIHDRVGWFRVGLVPAGATDSGDASGPVAMSHPRR